MIKWDGLFAVGRILWWQESGSWWLRGGIPCGGCVLFFLSLISFFPKHTTLACESHKRMGLDGPFQPNQLVKHPGWLYLVCIHIFLFYDSHKPSNFIYPYWWWLRVNQVLVLHLCAEGFKHQYFGPQFKVSPDRLMSSAPSIPRWSHIPYLQGRMLLNFREWGLVLFQVAKAVDSRISTRLILLFFSLQYRHLSFDILQSWW